LTFRCSCERSRRSHHRRLQEVSRKMGPAIVGAIAARQVISAREQEVFNEGQRQRDLKDRERKKKHQARERELRRQEEAEEKLNRKRLEAWFEKYDKDASGLLESNELKLLLADVLPDEQPPEDEAVEALLAGFPSGVGVDEIIRATLRYEAYLQDKKRLDDAFAALYASHTHCAADVAFALHLTNTHARLDPLAHSRCRDIDGSGLLEKMELVRVMGDLVPSLPEIADSDLNFVYDRMPTHVRGEPVPRDLIGVLLPACAEWAKLARKAASVSERGIGKEVSSRTPKAADAKKSSACVLL
jgi:hypothetical protein